MSASRKAERVGGMAMLLLCLGTAEALASRRQGDDQEGRIDQLRREFNRAYNAGDASAIATLLAEDAVWMPPGQPAIEGKQAIARRYRTQFAGIRSEFTLNPGEVQVFGNQALLRGTFQRVDRPAQGGPPTSTEGKYLMVFQRQRGSWKIAVDIWNSNESPLQVDAQVALRDLRSLAECRLRGVQQALSVLASTNEVRSGEWNSMVRLLRSLAGTGIQANAIWFARPDGSYYSLDQGLTGLSLADRPYFPGLMAGRSVLGALVISRSTGRRSVIIAEPVTSNGRVIGALGVSYSVDQLSQELDQQMALPAHAVFYALDGEGQTALHRDPNLMFEYPSDLGDQTLQAAVTELLGKERGTVEYDFRGMHREVLFERSPTLGWVFALGFGEPVATPLH